MTDYQKQRALENEHDAIKRKQLNVASVAKKKALENEHDAIKRKQLNAASVAKKRTLENEHDAIKRKQSNAGSMAKKRKRDVCIEEAITIFHSKAKIGPRFVCTVCHPMMYRQTVVHCNKGIYNKASPDVIANVFCNEFPYVSLMVSNGYVKLVIGH